MIRFCDSKIRSVEFDELNKFELDTYFSDCDYTELICVYEKEKYKGYIPSCSWQKGDNIYESLQKDFLLLDETIWSKGRTLFIQNGMNKPIPVLNKEYQLVCFAWQDEEANRELRMLRELNEHKDALTFLNLNPGYTTVTIHDCNELAWNFAEYLRKLGIKVNVVGKYWRELFCEGYENKDILDTLYYQNYEIWAEGVHQKSGYWKKEWLRSATVEFECIDKIYEANIKAGIIKDVDSDYHELLDRLRKENEVIIRGIGTKAQDAYDWLFSNGVDICAFQSDRADKERKTLFGKPIVKKEYVSKHYKGAVIIECCFQHSAWGFGSVDTYDYEGYERNKQYLLLKDYIEVPENNLVHVLEDKNLILIGDIHLCNRLYRWFKNYGWKEEKIGYWDVLGENNDELQKLDISEIAFHNLKGENIYLLVATKHSSKYLITDTEWEKYSVLIQKIKENGVTDYTEYFSDMIKSIRLQTEIKKYHKKELCPGGILLGAIPGNSGNDLIRQSLAGHPQIIMIEEYSYLNNDLYSLCLRLAEEKPSDIASDFWTIYQKETIPWTIYPKEAEEEAKTAGIRDKEKFLRKIQEMLPSDYVTSQELFIIFHVAYASMHGQDVSNLENMIIYWEPHFLDRIIVREFAYWLESEDIKGYTLSTTRNRYIRAGSRLRRKDCQNWLYMYVSMYRGDKRGRKYDNWKEYIMRFEDLKCSARETLSDFCEWLGIKFHDCLMQTTWHGEIAFSDDITGFDIKPALNLYEEYFSVFDRMRISLLSGTFQKKYGYPYVSCLTFTRRELQEMFLKDFRWEKIVNDKDLRKVQVVYKSIRKILWIQRYAEIMNVQIDEIDVMEL